MGLLNNDDRISTRCHKKKYLIPTTTCSRKSRIRLTFLRNKDRTFSSVMGTIILLIAAFYYGCYDVIAYTTTSTIPMRQVSMKSYRNNQRAIFGLHSMNSPIPTTTDTATATTEYTTKTTANTTATGTTGSAIIGTDPITKPNYDTMIGPFGKNIDLFCMTLFRNRLRDQVIMPDIDDEDADDDIRTSSSIRISNISNNIQRPLRADPMYYGTVDYTQIVSLAAAMNARYKTQTKMIQYRAEQVLQSLFPKWLPKWYKILFAQPFPIFSARMNAYVTAALGVWLMGECTINDIDIMPMDGIKNNTTTITTIASTGDGTNQGVLVTRCRFLEESQCASICINSCKIPTQNFFYEQMGVPLLMEPNYSTGSCQFSFGRYPNVTSETIAIQTPCLSRCPTGGSYRPSHSKVPSSSSRTVQTAINSIVYSNTTTDSTTTGALCSMM